MPSNQIFSDEAQQVVVFVLDEPLYALPLASVERVIRSVEITPLPKAPEIVYGVIDKHGQIIPVINLRKRFGLPERELTVHDRMIIAHSTKRTLALVVDSISDIRALDEKKFVSAKEELPFADYLQGVGKLENGLALIFDLDLFLSLEEEKLLDSALAKDSE